MKRVLIFKTTVNTGSHVRMVKPLLDSIVDKYERWNFDLEDCDCILRVESASAQATTIMQKLETAGFACTELED